MSFSGLIGKNLAWLNSMKQKTGYCGPVIHYWQDSINFIGPGMDWRYEGLIEGYLELFRKTNQKEFLNLAIECGGFLISAQTSKGTFFNSGFESNPTYSKGSTPHESAACLGLVRLSEELKKQGMDFRKFYSSAKLNLDKYHFGSLYFEEKEIFAQYPRKDAELVPNAFVPNKICTAIEFLFALSDFKEDKKLLRIAEKNAEFVISMQSEENHGIFQSNDKNKLISLYTARCIPALIKTYKKTGKEQFLESALKAAQFVKSMEHKSNGFKFGLMNRGEGWAEFAFPVFAAGGSEMLRALNEAAEFKKSLAPTKKNIEFVKNSILESGGFKTSIGMNCKNTEKTNSGKESWRDTMPVVGWNDKALRFFASKLEEGKEIEIPEFTETKIECSDGTYFENEHEITISGKENHYFGKKNMFSGKKQALKKIAFLCSNCADRTGFRSKTASKAIRLAGLK